MRPQSFFIFSVASLALAAPAPFPQGTGSGADSCPSDPLTTDTWTKLKMDDFLAQTAKNYTKTSTNNIQSLAASFGAPNFFCGLDAFCNAGQPCLPIKPPAWYAAVAIQNWNNYMNSLNTGITFASSILSLRLSQIVTDVMPTPVDNITPLKNIGTIFGAILGVVPLTGPISTAKGIASSGLSFVLSRAKPPQPADKFLTWSKVSDSMADIVQQYQGIISDTTTNIINAPIDDPNNGINAVLTGGEFLGVAQNFTQKQLQDAIIDSLTQTALGAALQAQKIFITRFFNRASCNRDNLSSDLCKQNEGSSTVTIWSLLKSDDKGNAQPQTDIASTLLSKYNMTSEQMLKGPTDCFDGNGKKQLVDPVQAVGALPTDPHAPCLFNLLVCDIDTAAGTDNQGIVDFCNSKQGLGI